MILLHIRTRKPFATASADSLYLPQVRLIHMASAALLLDKFRASGPSALYFVLGSLNNGGRQ